MCMDMSQMLNIHVRNNFGSANMFLKSNKLVSFKYLRLKYFSLNSGHINRA